MANDDPTTDRSQPAISDAVDALISEFTHRLQRGEGLTIDEFTERHPQFADELKRLLPTVRALAGLAQAGDPVPDSPLPTLGDFQLLREIGRGGMGVVYEAEQLSLGRRVALKVLPFAGVLDPRQLQRFRNEARAAATLDHPHIVHVHAVGQERGVHFYAMQLIDGRSLAEFVQEMQPSAASTAVMTPHPNRTRAADGTAPQQNASTLCSATAPGHYRQVARWGVDAAEALDYAHQMGIVHRDIKPSNLLINREGRLWVADFGLAMTRTDQGMTMTGDVLGTLRYMSPEQLRGHRSIIDQRTDIYSLGVTLYELLALRPAFPNIQRADILRGRREDQLVPLRRIRRDIPVDLETIVLKAQETDPGDRFETAQAMADDLKRFLDDRPIVARPPRWHETLMKWGRRHTGVLAAALVTTLFVVVILTVSVVLVAQARRTALVSERERRMELASFEFERSLARCTPQDAATGLLWLTKSLERVRELGATQLESGIRRQIAGWSQHVPVQKMVWSHEAPVLSVAFSSDGRTALSASQDGETCLWNVETGAPGVSAAEASGKSVDRSTQSGGRPDRHGGSRSNGASLEFSDRRASGTTAQASEQYSRYCVQSGRQAAADGMPEWNGAALEHGQRQTCS
jgi:serine/threonine protein kinase